MAVLKDVSFEVKEGEQIALVGASGSGKSTVANLLLRFYDSTEGQIIYDGIPSSNWKLHDLRKSMAYVPQEVLLFGGTIRENIAYGKPTATDEEVKSAEEKQQPSQPFSGEAWLKQRIGNQGQQVQTVKQPQQRTEAQPQTQTAPGMNPPHGQPGHRCEIPVGAPLNSKPVQNTQSQKPSVS